MLSSFEEDMEKDPSDKERRASLNGGMQGEPKDKQSKIKLSANKSQKVAEESAKPKIEELKSQSNLRDDQVGASGGAEKHVKLENKESKSQSVSSNSAQPKNEESKSRTNLRDDQAVSGGACVRDVKRDERKQCCEVKKHSKKPSKSQAGCSKNCTGIKDGDEPDAYNFTVCTSAKQNKLAYRIKRSKKRIREISKQVKSGTKRSVKKLKNICKSINAKRAMGFKCDLRKCGSTLVECSKSCAKSDMLFSGSGKEKARKSDDQKHHTVSERQTGTMTNELATNRRKQSDKSIVTVEEKDTNT